MKSSTLWFGVIVVLAIIAGYVLLKSPANYDDFARCLNNSGARMYGAWWCTHCADQKELFKGSFPLVPYIECSDAGSRSQNSLCTSANIRSYPTWVFGDGRRLEGVLSFKELSRVTGCALSS